MAESLVSDVRLDFPQKQYQCGFRDTDSPFSPSPLSSFYSSSPGSPSPLLPLFF
jgi:hypothetical protein